VITLDLEEMKTRLTAIEPRLDEAPFIEAFVFQRDQRPLHVAITATFRKHSKKEGVWKSKEMFASLKNAAYGFDPNKARSVGGRDGIFLLDRNFRPPNPMMRKVFDHFLDKPSSGAKELAASLGVTLQQLLPVRLVSHHLRLLGVLAQQPHADLLVLVDCDRSE